MNKCKVCDNEVNNTSYIGVEMMFGLKDEFPYFKCSKCGCLQIKTIPDSMSKYYPGNYYSYSNDEMTNSLKSKIVNYLLEKSISTRLGYFNLLGGLAMIYNDYYKNKYCYLNKDVCNYNSKILDIGCGSGALLNWMKNIGFNNLTGIDPYLKENIQCSNGVNILKMYLSEVSEKYEFIMMHHSFEHMPEPKEVFYHLNRIMSDNGHLIIRIPLVDGYAWRKYGMKWFQVDAPRHFFLHTVHSIYLLAEMAGLKIEKIEYDSQLHQILLSEKCLRNIPLTDDYFFPSELQRYASKKSIELNSLMDGDQACFYLKKSKN